jgi:hypothetical protein
MQVSLARCSFCFAVLAFRVETLYLARRFCGLRDCNVNPIFSDLFLRRYSFVPGKRGFVCRDEHTERTIDIGYALNPAGHLLALHLHC